jgi:hypothetical protein
VHTASVASSTARIVTIFQEPGWCAAIQAGTGSKFLARTCAMLTLLTMTGTRKQGAKYPADRYGLGEMATLGDTPGNGCPALGFKLVAGTRYTPY